MVIDQEALLARPTLSKRGIPGVNSDAYHFGYFEDYTAHRASPPEHSEYEAFLEPLYIFAGLLLLFIILTLILFCLREYTWSLKEKGRLNSSGSAWSNHSIILTAVGAHNDDQFQQRNRAYPELEGSGAETGSPLVLYMDASSTPRTDDKQERADDDDDEDSDGESPVIVPLNVLNLSTGSLTEHNEGSGGLRTGFSKRSPPPGIIGYSIRKLIDLKPPEYNGVPSLTGKQGLIRPGSVEDAIRSYIPFQPFEFKSGRVAEKSIGQIASVIRGQESDPATRSLAIFRLIGIAASCTQMNNANVFLPGFNRTMDFLVDTGIIFNILNSSNAYLSRLLVDLVIQYCYCHWTFGKDRDPRILEQFRKWKLIDPLAQPHYVLFRYMINLQLGLYTVEEHLDEELLAQITTRTTTMLTQIAMTSTHGDPTKIAPILSQAVEFTESQELKTLYYDLLLKLTEVHVDCCMGLMLRRKDADLKALIQSGLWVKNNKEVVKRAKKVYKMLLKRAPAIHLWYDEVNGGAVYVAPPPRQQPETTQDISHTDKEKSSLVEEDDGKPMRPGSWKSSSPKKR